ncbi:hypothetical protein FO519_004463 [Halicephalobus sp. NKZ332]|nr:hypothetical protein FO519_004463 [Halicephalobus sp. NKZ332]
MSVSVQQTSPVPTNAARFPSGYEHITWAPKKKVSYNFFNIKKFVNRQRFDAFSVPIEEKFKPRIFVPPSEASDDSSKSSIPATELSSPERSSTPKLPKKANPVQPKRLNF